MVVPLGGFLFEYYMWTASGSTHNRRWLSLNSKIPDDTALDNFDQRHTIEQSINGFVGWLLLHIASIGTNGRRQLFYITFLSRYYGLSRSGVDTMHRMGYGLSMTMMDDMTEKYHLQSLQSTRYVFGPECYICHHHNQRIPTNPSTVPYFSPHSYMYTHTACLCTGLTLSLSLSPGPPTPLSHTPSIALPVSNSKVCMSPTYFGQQAYFRIIPSDIYLNIFPTRPPKALLTTTRVIFI